MNSGWSGRAAGLLERARPFRMGLSLPLLAMAIVVVADLLAGRDHYLTPGIVAAPAIASITVTWRLTLAVSLLGAGVQAALGPYDGVSDLRDQDVLGGQIIAYAVVSVFSVYVAWRRESGDRAYTAIVSVAEAAQHALMRPPEPRVGPVRLAVRYVSAADAAQIGGDLYAVLQTPYGVRVLIGDVRGKGLAAVQTSAVVLGAFREAAYDEGGLDAVALRVDTSVRRHVAEGDFITALFAQFDAPGSVQLLHYGHVAPLRVSPDGRVETLAPAEPWVPLGLGDMVRGGPTPWREPLGPGDVLVLCTDGVIEARGQDRAFYPLAERVGGLVAGGVGDLDAAVERVYGDLLRHAAGALSDDVVLLFLSRT